MSFDFDLKDEVVCWDRATKPLFGAISELPYKGNSVPTNAVRVHLHDEKVAPNRIWLLSQVYKNPEDLVRLRNDMSDWSFSLQQQANEIDDAIEQIKQNIWYMDLVE